MLSLGLHTASMWHPRHEESDFVPLPTSKPLSFPFSAGSMSTQSTVIGPKRWSLGTLPRAAEGALRSRVLSPGVSGSRSKIDLGTCFLTFGVSLRWMVNVCMQWQALLCEQRHTTSGGNWTLYENKSHKIHNQVTLLACHLGFFATYCSSLYVNIRCNPARQVTLTL